jgi:heme A synthase
MGFRNFDTAEWRRRDHAINYEDANKAEVELIRGVFQKAADALPTCPTFVFEDGWLHRKSFSNHERWTMDVSKYVSNAPEYWQLCSRFLFITVSITYVWLRVSYFCALVLLAHES